MEGGETWNREGGGVGGEKMLWVDLKLYIIFLSQSGPAIQILEQRGREGKAGEEEEKELHRMAFSSIFCAPLSPIRRLKSSPASHGQH